MEIKEPEPNQIRLMETMGIKVAATRHLVLFGLHRYPVVPNERPRDPISVSGTLLGSDLAIEATPFPDALQPYRLRPNHIFPTLRPLTDLNPTWTPGGDDPDAGLLSLYLSAWTHPLQRVANLGLVSRKHFKAPLKDLNTPLPTPTAPADLTLLAKLLYFDA